VNFFQPRTILLVEQQKFESKLWPGPMWSFEFDPMIRGVKPKRLAA
jgi:hypothetical protein